MRWDIFRIRILHCGHTPGSQCCSFPLSQQDVYFVFTVYAISSESSRVRRTVYPTSNRRLGIHEGTQSRGWHVSEPCEEGTSHAPASGVNGLLSTHI